MTTPCLILPNDRTEAEVREQRRAALEQRSRAILDEHCEHTDLNAHQTRCLSCGLWLGSSDER